VSAASPASGNDARRLRATKASDDAPVAQPRLEEFDALVRALLPTVQASSPKLSSIEALREAARLAEAQMRETAWITWGPPRL
jgi:hypothetical protein